GSEFADLTSCLEHTATEVYYAHPFSSWERGANEQNNGMIRRFIPKGIDPQSVTPEMVHRVESWLNHYPKKVLGYASSFDVFYQYTSSHAA
ncbi:IS30 family transposase, partial [Proteiniclasticum ruminis]|uniref:IS30 family transposase n=1 Tax=Proteiniclasticum ruminis TaxID=398199 RepID=UPI0004E244BB